MITGFLLPKTILDEKVPATFFEGIEEFYDVTFRDYGHWFFKDEESPLLVLEIGKYVGTCNFTDCTNSQAWIDYFAKECAVYDIEG